MIYYLTAFFHVVGIGFIGAQNLSLFAILALSGLGMYLLSGQVFGPRGGLVSAVAYLFAPYLIVVLYVRYALADFSAFAFMPFAFWGIYRYTTDGGYWRLLLGAFSTALIVLSSSSVALVTFPALSLFLVTVLVFGWRGRDLRVISAFVRGMWLLLLSLALSAFSWFPALAEKQFVHMARRTAGGSEFQDHFVYIQQLFFPVWDYGISLPGPGDRMNFAIGNIHLFLLGASIWVIWRTFSNLREGGFLVLFFVSTTVFAAFLTLGASTFIWERISIMQLLQFPWRFLSLIAMSTTFLSGSLFLLPLRIGDRWANGLMWLLIVSLIAVGVGHAIPQRFLTVTDASISPSTIAATGATTNARQLEPIWVQRRPSEPPDDRLIIIEGKGQVFTSKVTPTYYDYVTESTVDTRMRVNTYYFPGWKVFVDEIERPVEIDELYGLMEFPLESGKHRIQVRFTDTSVRKWSERVSFLALMLLLMNLWMIRGLHKLVRTHWPGGERG